jgi:hypothetical protein
MFMRPTPPLREAELDLAARANKALARSHVSEIQQLMVQSHCAGVFLIGRVRSYYHKQLAQELVRNALDGGQIVNEVQVLYIGDDR